jgi:hypothetical protein
MAVAFEVIPPEAALLWGPLELDLPQSCYRRVHQYLVNIDGLRTRVRCGASGDRPSLGAFKHIAVAESA